ncbi:MAG: hypothetical protein DMG67_18090 [Acidobacteria bacterium]|nr:MAG: hypothetical protein DMG67_18090 [Acidobacteriota bacterium]
MGLDIRLPIGVLFTVFGIVLTVFGALSNRALYERSLGININLMWGIVLLLFGLGMLILGRRRALPKDSEEETANLTPQAREKQNVSNN